MKALYRIAVALIVAAVAGIPVSMGSRALPAILLSATVACIAAYELIRYRRREGFYR